MREPPSGGSGAESATAALDLFEEALNQPEPERETWLRARCAGDAALLTAVSRLLTRDAGAAAVLPTELAEPAPAEALAPPPARVGAYRVGASIGEGGMGTVYRAERDDGLFEHTAAVKLLRSSRLDSREAELFAAERSTLARLNHPNIARLLDGGVTPQGAPYILMDYVEGRHITDDVTARAPSSREVVDLLLQVCAAVAYAHRSLVAHGDLKPANVLVTPEGQIRLLDFGVSRMIDRAADPVASPGPLTNAYASPQRRGGEPPTAADDIYALGVMGRELLERRGPTLGAETAAVSLDRDLEAVLSKAAAEEVHGRYGSVDRLADDLERWRDRRPVAARGRGAAYVTGRFAARRPGLVAAGAITFAALAATAVISTALYLRAEREHLAAERRFADARQMANYLLFDVYDRLDRAPRTLAVRRDLAATGQGYLDRLTADPRAPVGVRVEAVRGLVRLAVVQGGGKGRNLGQVEQSRKNLERAVAMADQLASDYPGRADVALAQADARIEQAMLVVEREGEAAEAERTLAVARRALNRAAASGQPAATITKAEVQWALQMSNLRQWQGRYPEGVAHGRAALSAIAKLPPVLRRQPETRLLEAKAHDLIAEGTYYGGDEAGAVAPYRRQLTIVRALAEARPDDPVVLRAVSRAGWALGTTLLSLDRAREALHLLETADREAESLVAFDPEDEQARRTLVIVRHGRAQALAGVGRYDEALPLLRARADALRESLRRRPNFQTERDYALAIASLADVYADAKRTGPACRAYAEAMGVWKHLERSKRLTRLDQDYSIRLIRERTTTLCPSAEP